MLKVRKYISLFIIITVSLLLFTGFVPATIKDVSPETPAAEKLIPVNDIAGHPGEAAISEMYLKDIMKGYPDKTFRPNHPISKIQAVVMLVRVMGLAPTEKLTGDQPYLQENFHLPRWANGYVITALNEQLISYSELETIAAQKPLSRQDAARLVIRALGLSNIDEKQNSVQLDFTDAKLINLEFRGYVALAIEKRLMSTNAEGAFQPYNPVTRGEIAILFSRADEFLPEHDREVIGTYVYSATSGPTTLNITNKNILITIALADNYLLFRDGKAAGRSDLQTGDNVKVVKNSNDKGVLILVTAAPKPECKEIRVEPLKVETAAEAIQVFVTKNKTTEDYFVLNHEGYLYILVTRGEKPNSGYAIEITKITANDDNKARNLEVTVVKSSPKPGFFYTLPLTYRLVLTKVPLDDKEPGQVSFVDETGKVLKKIPALD